MAHPDSLVAPRPSLGTNYSWLRSIFFLVALSWAPFTVGLLLWMGLITVRKEIILHREGISTEAVVVAQRPISPIGEESDRILTLRYRAPPPGASTPVFYQQDAVVRAELYLKLAGKRVVLIRHARTNPTLFRLSLDSPRPVLTQMVLVFGFASLFCVVFVGEMQCITAMILLTFRGDTLQGRLVDQWEDAATEGGTIYCVSYNFQPPSGVPRVAAEVNSSAFHRLRPGDPVKVRVVRGRPGICRLES